MEESTTIAKGLFDKFRGLITGGLSAAQAQTAEAAFIPWIQAQLDRDDRELYTQEEVVDSLIPDEINYLFQGLDPGERYEKAITAYDQLRVQRLNEKTYEQARMFLLEQGDVVFLKAQAEANLVELKEIEGRLSKEYPAVYKQFKRQISESKLDCLYIIRDGGAASLRLGREIQRLNQT